MKKIIVVFLLVLFGISPNVFAKVVSFDSFISADDVTIERLNNNANTWANNLNSIPGENLQSASVSSDALTNNSNPEYRWGESFNEFVYTGLLAPVAAASLSSTTTAGTAYIVNDTTAKMKRVVKDATAHTYTASKDTYVDLSDTGTYTYSAVNLNATEPSVASDSIRLFKVVTDGDNITTVTDKRVTALSLGTNDDFYIAGFEISTTSGDTATVTVDAGVLYHGSTRVEKTTNTILTLATDADWADGSADTPNGAWCYIGVDDDDRIKLLGNNPPTKADADGNTAGTSRYYYDNTDYWRVVSRISNDAGALAYTFYQTGDTIYYHDTQPFACGTATAYTEVDIGAVTSAIDDEADFWASSSNSDESIGFRNARSESGVGRWITNIDDANLQYHNAWHAVLEGGSYTRAIDYYQAGGGTVTGYVGAVRLSVR